MKKKNKNPEIYHINFDYNIVRLENAQHTNKNHTDGTKANFVSNARIRANFASSNTGINMPCWLCNEPFCRILRKFCKLYIAEF